MQAREVISAFHKLITDPPKTGGGLGRVARHGRRQPHGVVRARAGPRSEVLLITH